MNGVNVEKSWPGSNMFYEVKSIIGFSLVGGGY